MDDLLKVGKKGKNAPPDSHLRRRRATGKSRAWVNYPAACSKTELPLPGEESATRTGLCRCSRCRPTKKKECVQKWEMESRTDTRDMGDVPRAGTSRPYCLRLSERYDDAPDLGPQKQTLPFANELGASAVSSRL